MAYSSSSFGFYCFYILFFIFCLSSKENGDY